MSAARLFAMTLMLGMAGCGERELPSTPGWPSNLALRDREGPVLPAVESLAWRYDDDDGPLIEVWISAVPLTPQQRLLLRPARPGQPARPEGLPETLNLPGLLLRMRDDGDSEGLMLEICPEVTKGQVSCANSSGSGTVVVEGIDAKRVRGVFYSRSSDGMTLYAAAFDAPIVNESKQAVPDDILWSKNGKAAAAYLTRNTAALTGDVVALKAASMPERAGDFDDAKVVERVQSMALKEPRVLAARQRGDMARLHVRDAVADKFPSGIVTVWMQRFEGRWRQVGQSE